MTDFPVAGYIENAGRQSGEQKSALAAFLAATKQLPGGAAVAALTIAAGVITPTRAGHTVDTESAASTDDLTNIVQTNLPDGSVLILRNAAVGRSVVVKHGAGGAGQISLQAAADFLLSNPADALVLQRVGSLWQEVVHQTTSATTIPTGSVMPFAGAAAPSGFLLCDGAAVSRSTFAALFALLGTTYGAGNGSTTFNTPNLQGRTPFGKASAGTFVTLAGTGGAETHVLTVAELAAHSHTLNASESPALSTGTSGGLGNAAVASVGDTPVTIAGSTANAGSGAAHSILPPYLVLNMIIKT